jgi:hypothetical protein
MKGVVKFPLTARLDDTTEIIERRLEKLSRTIRVASPGIIQSFDANKQTVTVKIAIKEKMSFGGKPFEDLEIPILLDVPIYMPRAGNFVLTMPVTVGDECLVVFSDTCIDSWFDTGDVGEQIDLRRHDLSDGFAIIGVWSQPNVITSYSTDSVVLRNLNNDSLIEVKDTEINIKAPMKITIESDSEVEVKASTSATVEAPMVEVKASGQATIDSPMVMISNRNFLLHTHSGGIIPPNSLTGPVI